jgi:molecular chaperone DnaK
VSRILGIDLGTTNSCVAYAELATPRVLTNREGSRTTPSIVAFSEDDQRLVGDIARRQGITNPQRTIFAVKRLIGRRYADAQVQRATDLLPYPVVEAENGDAYIEVGDRTFSPQEIAAFILMELKAYAEEALSEEITEAVITVPAYFDDAQRQATRDAGRIAGLDVQRIINEPTAAALAYGLERGSDRQTLAVFDLGGGTFDISILELNEGVYEVRSTAGDTYLGGEDFDRCVMDWLIEGFVASDGIDLRADRMALQRLKEAAEKAKCELSVEEEAPINLPFIATDENGPHHLKRTLRREEFESLVQDLVERTEGPCRDALEAAGLQPHQIDDVLLVGGQTRTPLVQRTVEKIFGREARRDLNPDEVVAMGAALQAGILAGGVKDIVLLDVTPLSLGVETRGGLFTRLIERNSTIPTKNAQIFTTVEDNQDAVSIHVLQGERDIAAENRSLGQFELVGVPPAPRGVPQIEVTFAIDSNGIVNVSARDLATNRTQGIQINPAGGLTTEEVDRLVADAEAHRRSDRERRGLQRLKQRLEGLIYTSRKAFDQMRDLIPQSQQEEILAMLNNSTKALSAGQRGEIETALFDLSALSEQLSEFVLGNVDKATPSTPPQAETESKS